jgi:hypothetical protein
MNLPAVDAVAAPRRLASAQRPGLDPGIADWVFMDVPFHNRPIRSVLLSLN